MNTTEIKKYFKERLQVKSANPLIDDLLSKETCAFLQTVGLPNSDELAFDFDNSLSLLPNNLVQLESGEGKPLCLDLKHNEAVCWSEDPSDFVNTSVQQFVDCVYEFEQYYANIASKEVFGNFYDENEGNKNRLNYAMYLEEKFKLIDPAVFVKGYYWPAFIESIAHGLG